jgi:CheY-like chemotaxis protein
MDGYELARRLRALPQTAQAVLIALTGYGQAQDRERSRAAGFDHHLVKPADTKKLSALLAALDTTKAKVLSSEDLQSGPSQPAL